MGKKKKIKQFKITIEEVSDNSLNVVFLENPAHGVKWLPIVDKNKIEKFTK
jgi:hypothetical protein